MTNLPRVRFTRLAAVVFLLFPSIAMADKAKDEAEIRAAWDRYQDLVIAKKGKEATALLAKPTVAYYGRMRELALTAPAETVAAQPLLMRLSVYLMRHLLTGEQLKAMNTREFMAWSIDKGLVGNIRKGTMNIEKVTFDDDGNKAKAAIKVGNQPPVDLLRFAREDGVWKIDFAFMLGKLDKMMDARLKQSKIPDERILAIMVRKASKKPMDFAKLKEPLLKP